LIETLKGIQKDHDEDKKLAAQLLKQALADKEDLTTKIQLMETKRE